MPHDAAPFLLEIAVEPAHSRDRPALLAALDALVARSEGLDYAYDGQSHQIVLRGHDEAGLDEAIVALRDGHGLELRVGAPQVASRETLTRRIETDTTFRQRGDGGWAFARVKMRFEPSAESGFESQLGPSGFPPDFIAGVARGIAAARRAGVQAGRPIVDVKATLLDGAWHETDSSPDAFEAAATTAFREAQHHAGVLLEPIMQVEVIAPEDYIGFIHGDVVARRGEVVRTTRLDDGGVATEAMVPLVNLFGYRQHLHAGTQGRGAMTMRFSHFAPVGPPDPPRFPSAAALRVA